MPDGWLTAEKISASIVHETEWLNICTSSSLTASKVTDETNQVYIVPVQTWESERMWLEAKEYRHGFVRRGKASGKTCTLKNSRRSTFLCSLRWTDHTNLCRPSSEWWAQKMAWLKKSAIYSGTPRKRMSCPSSQRRLPSLSQTKAIHVNCLFMSDLVHPKTSVFCFCFIPRKWYRQYTHDQTIFSFF